MFHWLLSSSSLSNEVGDAIVLVPVSNEVVVDSTEWVHILGPAIHF
jgi:hypothetical protein